ncbi:cytochrome P450 [Kitasatospora sp. NA04385]|uniref:cytochrome P450 n=1 Tax=Kitasatospora sp. NA04385 TaxID=2742135 RepID=UPI001591D06C|nr:cytochrome P450 [Kitasatospora sp. NA04385]QKW22611.1 cytochrome P450 [Kitasatospora sp. NA04385]
MAVPVDAAPRGIDLGDPAFWLLPEEARGAAFARLRERRGPVGFTDRATGRRCWALVRHADVAAASRSPEVYLSGPGVAAPEPARWVRAVFGDSMLELDDPRHAELRRVVGRAFTPGLLAAVERDVERTAAELVDRLERERPTDFVPAVAAELPYRVVCSMLGLPDEQRRRILARTGPDGFGMPGQGLRALVSTRLAVAALGRERRRRPTGDLVSALVTADADGRRLGLRELGAFCSLLLATGAEATRDALAHGLHLLTVHPEQRALLLGDPDAHLDGAVEEIVRYATPVDRFHRTVAVDHRLSGIRLAAGDRVVLCYGSANRDEAVFRDPDAFDITRSPNPHLGFGGGGPHFCPGARLARRQVRALLRELFARLPEARSTAAPVTVPSPVGHRVRSLPFAF